MLVSLIIDNREKDLKVAFPDAIFKNLDLGDIEIKYTREEGNEELFLLIERKTMCDVISSVNDGRYREQKKRLLESNIPNDKIMYLLEGHIDDIPGQMKTLFGMLINTLFRDKLQVIRFESIEETIYFIKRIVEKLKSDDVNILKNIKKNKQINTILDKSENKNNEQNENDNNTENNMNNEQNNLEYLSTIKLKKKDNLTPLNCNLLQLAQIPGMSLQNAQIIIDKYGSIANLIKSYYDINDMDETKIEDKRIKMLIDLEISISNGKKRKLGKVLSERIYQYFFNKN
jgi:ERCC4-type nuclease